MSLKGQRQRPVLAQRADVVQAGAGTGLDPAPGLVVGGATGSHCD